MKKLGLLSVTGLTMLLGLVNVNTAKRAEAPKAQTLEVKDVLVKGATEGEGRVVRRAAAPATEYGMSDTFLLVTAPDADGTVDVTLSIEIKSVCQIVSPDSTANIPKAKDTERYPSPIGIPSFIPFKNFSFFIVSPWCL